MLQPGHKRKLSQNDDIDAFLNNHKDPPGTKSPSVEREDKVLKRNESVKNVRDKSTKRPEARK